MTPDAVEPARAAGAASETVGSKTNATAIVALVAAMLGFLCFWGVGGLLALILGLVSLREIERSDGRERGKALSITAIALGGLNLAAIVLAIGVGIAFLARPERPAIASPVPRTPPAVPAPRLAPADPGARGNAAEAPVPPKETQLGNVRLVEVAAGNGSLTRLLENQRRATRSAGEKLVVFVVAPDCAPCAGVSTAIPDRRMQAALDHVRLVQVDASEYAAELTFLGVPVEAVPGFALFGEALRPVDYVHGGEWDADIPENIAPVLGAFVRGKYLHRRHPFRGPNRPGETSL